jgi:hypothetical protein
MAKHVYHPIYRQCTRCGLPIERDSDEECTEVDYEPKHPEDMKRIIAAAGVPAHDIGARVSVDRILQQFEEKIRLECRALIQKHAQSTWKGRLIERSDGITEVLVDFDNKWPRRD